MMPDRKEESMSHVDEGTLHAYLDGELPSGDRATLEAHVAQCATCRTALVGERGAGPGAAAGASHATVRADSAHTRTAPLARPHAVRLGRVDRPCAWRRLSAARSRKGIRG